MSTTSATPEKCCNCGMQLKVSKLTDQCGNKFCGPCFKWMYGSHETHTTAPPVILPAEWPEPRYDPRPKIYC